MACPKVFTAPLFAGAMFWIMSMAMSFYNKIVFSHGFNFPIALCSVQAIGVMIFLFIWRLFDRFRENKRVFQSLTTKEEVFSLENLSEKAWVVMPIAVLLAINLVFGNWSLYVLDVSLYLLIRASSIVWIALFGFLLMKIRPTLPILVSCIMVFAGSVIVGWNTNSESLTLELDTWPHTKAMVYCLISTVANGLMLTIMKKLLSNYTPTPPNVVDDEHKSVIDIKTEDKSSQSGFKQMDYLWYQSLDIAVVLTIVSLFVEGPEMYNAIYDDLCSMVLIMLLSALLAVFYQLSLIGLVACTTPLGKEIISQTKLLPQTLLAIIFLSESFSVHNAVGLVSTLSGLLLYTFATRSKGEGGHAHK